MVKSSTESGFAGLLFNNEVFSDTPLKKMKFNERLFIDENHSFALKGRILGMGGSIFDTVKDTFKDIMPNDKGNINNLLKRLYLTFKKLYGFDK